jgi:hypothetical protein
MYTSTKVQVEAPMTERANPLIAARDNASLRKLEKRLAVPAHAERQQQNISDLETHILLSSRHFGFNLLDPLQDRHDANHGGAMHEKVAAPKCCAAGAENIRLPSTELFPLTMVYSKAIASRFAYHSKDETIKTIMFYRPFQTGSQVLTSIFLYLSSCRGCAGLRCVFFFGKDTLDEFDDAMLSDTRRAFHFEDPLFDIFSKWRARPRRYGRATKVVLAISGTFRMGPFGWLQVVLCR